MDVIEFHNKFWYFYLELENEFLEIEKIIPVHSINETTFSYTYVRLLGLICSEIDVVFKEFVEFKQFQIERDNMANYKKFIEETYEVFIENEISCHNIRFNHLKFQPFFDWSLNVDLKWWNINSAIKHNRNEKENGVEAYKFANQKNVLNALSGLFQLNMYFYKELAEDWNLGDQMPQPKSNIFNLGYWG